MNPLLKKGKFLLLSLGLICVLAGCVGESAELFEDSSLPNNSVSTKNEKDIQTVSREFTMYPENTLEDSYGHGYVFNGFISDDRLSFEREITGYHELGFKSIYHPATVGYTFEFKGFPDRTFEILEVSPEENYVKLKVTPNGE